MRTDGGGGGMEEARKEGGNDSLGTRVGAHRENAFCLFGGEQTLAIRNDVVTANISRCSGDPNFRQGERSGAAAEAGA